MGYTPAVSTETVHLDAAAIRASLQAFWNDALEIAETRLGLALAVPFCLPDGWQVLFDLRQVTPKVVRLTDNGRTLQWLAGTGLNIEAAGVGAQIQERMDTFKLLRDGWTLYRDLPVPPPGMDIHLFGEGLAAVAGLCCLHEPKPRTLDVARETVEKIFRERGLSPGKNHPLDGLVEKKIKVDYYLPGAAPMAMQVLGRRGPLLPYMEQWGFRWRDLRDASPALQRAMIFDPDQQDLDPVSRAIGDSVCELFCPYHETNRIHDLLDRVGAG
jgi:hypothetical protein